MTTRPSRLPELDLFKSLLVVGMVAIHVLQLLSRSMPGWTRHAEAVINLVTFSGFLLAMGIGLGLSRGGSRAWRQRLWPVVLLLLATYASSFAFALLVDRLYLNEDLIVDVLTMRRLFGWSEFLASFTVLYALLAVARPLLVWIASHPIPLILAITLCLASTWLTFDAEWPLSATLFGTTLFSSFPLLAYLPWFLVGVATGNAGGRRNPWHLAFACVGSATLLWHLAQHGGNLPERFPPTVAWVVGPALLLVIYLQISRLITARIPLPSVVTVPGRHVLSFLLLSNLALFTVRNLEGRPITELWSWAAVTAVILVAITAGWTLWEHILTRRRSAGFDQLSPSLDQTSHV